jgi:hypothetical protein
MFKTIVLALDGSEGSKRAIPVALELAQREGGKIVVAHVEQDVAGKGGGSLGRCDQRSRTARIPEDRPCRCRNGARRRRDPVDHRGATRGEGDRAEIVGTR